MAERKENNREEGNKETQSKGRGAYRIYFAASPRENIASLAGCLFFGIGAALLYPYGNWLGLFLFLLVAAVCLMELLHLVILTPEGILHVCYFRVRQRMAWEQVCQLSTLMEKQGISLYILGDDAHFTVIKREKMWQELLARLEVPEAMLVDFSKDGDETLEQKEGIFHWKRDTVYLDRLMGKKKMTVYEINIQRQEGQWQSSQEVE